jgi:hypothetical protein
VFVVRAEVLLGCGFAALGMSRFSLFFLRANLEAKAELPAGNERNRGLLARTCYRHASQLSINSDHMTTHA